LTVAVRIPIQLPRAPRSKIRQTLLSRKALHFVQSVAELIFLKGFVYFLKTIHTQILLITFCAFGPCGSPATCACDPARRRARVRRAGSCGTPRPALYSAVLQVRSVRPTHPFQHTGSTRPADSHHSASSAHARS